LTERTSAQRKFLRGVEQVRDLLAQADAFEQRNAYVFRAEVESRSAQHVTYRCFAVEQEAPPDEWSLLAGEAIQNLRASLDHLVWPAHGNYGDYDHKQVAGMIQSVGDFMVRHPA
jgi:hypothetical protein